MQIRHTLLKELCTNVLSNKNNKSKNMLEINIPEKNVKVIVAENDFEYQMNWAEAEEACYNLGDGWRLPTKKELEIIYKELHQKGKGNFKNYKYWSSEEDIESYHDYVAWDFNFSDGNFYSNAAKNNVFNVRAVRTL